MIQWITRQYSRFDLALTKLSRPLVAINTLSNLAVAVVVGLFIFGTLAIFAFVGIAVLGYGLHKSGFFMETVNEAFDQQQKILYHRQVRLNASEIATCLQMSPEDLERCLEEARGALRL